MDYWRKGLNSTAKIARFVSDSEGKHHEENDLLVDKQCVKINLSRIKKEKFFLQ